VWGDQAVRTAVQGGVVVLDELDDLAARGAPLTGDPDEIDDFLARLPEAVRAWRGGW
jgi:hypothetical protein